MEQVYSWEANSRTASQEIHRILRTAHLRIHKSSPPDAILSWMNLVHAIIPYSF
jgi:hypothetical protein